MATCLFLTFVIACKVYPILSCKGLKNSVSLAVVLYSAEQPNPLQFFDRSNNHDKELQTKEEAQHDWAVWFSVGFSRRMYEASFIFRVCRPNLVLWPFTHSRLLHHEEKSLSANLRRQRRMDTINFVFTLGPLLNFFSLVALLLI